MSTRVNGSGKPLFELPALDFNFGSITDGTIIPPPESPKVPTPPQTPPPTKTVVADAAVNGNGIGIGNGTAMATESDAEFEKSTSPNGNLTETTRLMDEAPLSPVGSTQQGSLRRLFSRNVLNANYTDGNLLVSQNGSRPPSRSASSVMGVRRSKRDSWFKLFRGGESKRSSMFLDNSTSHEKQIQKQIQKQTQKQTGSPPPMIPELKHLERDEGSLGNDLFKNIRG